MECVHVTNVSETLENGETAANAGMPVKNNDETVTNNSIKTPTNASEETPTNSAVILPNPLSKNQLKKQKRLAAYELLKKTRRLKERERHKQKSKERQTLGLPTRTGPTRKAVKKHYENVIENTKSISIAIDLDYDDLMSEKDIAKCIKQCLRIYTINRRSHCPSHLHLTGIKNNGNIHATLKKNDGWENWKVKFYFDKAHHQVFPTEKLIYLTCESADVLQSLEQDKVYVIGGLVDHNHYKGLCHERAIKAGLKTARLPLSEHVDMKTREVLSTFHVFEILLRVAEGKTWSDAILQTIPSRKGAKLKNVADEKADLPDKIEATIATKMTKLPCLLL